ncbi:Spx/MgsR family RNA polymerase-binding regulatory protein [Bacillus salacetis]|uniref:Spx/MgsR family RNA polymerase-binding regulatory protein n=1 Tax=Bacillus salacetis TaxID=2315464 RepID=A0A3A1R8X3_9BACI|nr:Spx/MgsR family RNA polymerase-binding regulatory protein [Bacillus salacetis]RIW37420.1 Spx/MgsR family RNA polymerase-binding regulatory protein [Bacillus salacetis]
MTVTVYGRTCRSTKRAKQWLKDNGIPFVERNIVQEPITASEMHNILHMTQDGTDEILATRSQLYKDLDVNLDELSLNELLEIINENPKLLKSPILVDEKRILSGFSEDIRQFLPRKSRLNWRMKNVDSWDLIDWGV